MGKGGKEKAMPATSWMENLRWKKRKPLAHAVPPTGPFRTEGSFGKQKEKKIYDGKVFSNLAIDINLGFPFGAPICY